MKKFRAIALIGATALVATGCSAGGGGGEGSADGTGPISIWLSNNEQEVAWGTAVVEACLASLPVHHPVAPLLKGKLAAGRG